VNAGNEYVSTKYNVKTKLKVILYNSVTFNQ